MSTIRKAVEQLVVQYAHEDFYTVSEETIHIDRRRSCWICGAGFQIGDGMTVCCTNSGNKLVHSRCYREQQEAS